MFARLAALVVFFGLAIASSAAAADPTISRVWYQPPTHDNGAIEVHQLSDGAYEGVVRRAFRSADCLHPVGEVMWRFSQIGPRKWRGTQTGASKYGCGIPGDEFRLLRLELFAPTPRRNFWYLNAISSRLEPVNGVHGYHRQQAFRLGPPQGIAPLEPIFGP